MSDTHITDTDFTPTDFEVEPQREILTPSKKTWTKGNSVPVRGSKKRFGHGAKIKKD